MAKINTKAKTKTVEEASVNAELPATEVQEVVEDTVIETVKEVMEEPKVVKQEVPKKVEAVKPALTDLTLIPVKCLVNKLSYTDVTTGLRYRWETTEDVVDMTYAELKTMMRTTPNMLKKLFVVIDNEEVVTALHLNNLYKKVNKMLAIEWTEAKAYDVEAVSEVVLDLIKSFPDTRGIVRDYLIGLISSRKVSDIYFIRGLGNKLGMEDSFVNAAR